MVGGRGRVNGAVTAMAGFPSGTGAIKSNSKIVCAAMPLYCSLLKGARDR